MEGFNKVHAGCKSGPLKERQHPILHRAHQHEGKAFKSIKVSVSLYGAAAFFRTGGPLHQAVQKPKPGLLHHWPMAPEQLSPAQINSYVQDKMPKISSILSYLVRRGQFSCRPWLSHHHLITCWMTPHTGIQHYQNCWITNRIAAVSAQIPASKLMTAKLSPQKAFKPCRTQTPLNIPENSHRKLS